MVKSVFRKGSFIGFLILSLLAIFCGLFTYAMISVHFFKSDLFRSALTKGESAIFICLFGFITFFIIKILVVHPMNITIDTNKKEIVFINIFFAIKKSYSFSDFDYFIETVEHTIGDPSSKAIYLIKNKKLKKAIRGYYYSNINEIQKALNGISDHGFKKLSSKSANLNCPITKFKLS
ncbi:MAG: hypothetical protein ABIR78_05935 [Ferruginibacter sp.]